MYKKSTREDILNIFKDMGNEAPNEDVLNILMSIEDIEEAAWIKGFNAGVQAATNRTES